MTHLERAPRSEESACLSGIGEVASRTGVSERTLRYYEEVGLLRPAAHEPGHRRRYCEADVERVVRIRELQSLMGFNLDEIRDVVSAEDRLELLRSRFRVSGDEADQRRALEEASGVLEDLHEQVRAKLERMQAFFDELDDRLARNERRLAEWSEAAAN